jgi:acyl carrier protein
MHDEIRRYVLATSANGEVQSIGDGESLLSAGVIDSAAMVDLIAHLERTYGISVDEDDMTPENFDTIDAIAAYVAAKREAK